MIRKAACLQIAPVRRMLRLPHQVVLVPKARLVLKARRLVPAGTNGTNGTDGASVSLGINTDTVGNPGFTDVTFTILDRATGNQIPGTATTTASIPDGAQGGVGPAGMAGAQGAQGSYQVQLFQRAATQPVAPTGTWTPGAGRGTYNGTDGWQLTVPTGTDQLWEVEGFFDPASETEIAVADWSVVFQGGAIGPAGPTGPAGVGIDTTNTSYNDMTGVLTVAFTNGMDVMTSDLRGAAGAAGPEGNSVTNIQYDNTTGFLTFTIADADGNVVRTITTPDIRGPHTTGVNFGPGVFDATTGETSFDDGVVTLSDGSTVDIDDFNIPGRTIAEIVTDINASGNQILTDAEYTTFMGLNINDIAPQGEQSDGSQDYIVTRADGSTFTFTTGGGTSPGPSEIFTFGFLQPDGTVNRNFQREADPGGSVQTLTLRLSASGTGFTYTGFQNVRSSGAVGTAPVPSQLLLVRRILVKTSTISL